MVDPSATGNKRAGEKTVPFSLYRFQFSNAFPIASAIELAGYLKDLGAGGIYASPLASSRPGSTHGYDGINPNEIDYDRGRINQLNEISDKVHDAGMKLVMDWVPNHLGTGYENPYWRDILKYGQNSEYANFFDINWDMHDGRVLLPTLGNHLGKILEAGEIRLAMEEDGEITVNYWENKFPLAPDTLPVRENETASAAIERLNEPESAHEMARLLNRQPYRLAYWRSGFGEINYRRFFDINDLAGVRQEDPEVFKEFHRNLLELVKEEKIDGLRLDHTDGLYDPGAYFNNLQNAIISAREDGTSLPVWIEKIIEGNEKLRNEWPVSGDTGYPFMNQVSGLFVDPASKETMTGLYEEVSGDNKKFRETLQECKKMVIEYQFAQELKNLTDTLYDIAKQNPLTGDYTKHDMSLAIERLMIGMPVYRTYISKDMPVSDEDLEVLGTACRAARSIKNPPLHPEAIDFLCSVLDRSILEKPGYNPDEVNSFIHYFQQCTGPVMAKAKEDTACYRYFRLASLNEVGGEPGHYGTSAKAFHEANMHRQTFSPHTMLDTTTHDTKRSEDTRMRINVLSQIPMEWESHVRMWMQNNKKHKSEIELPDGSAFTAPRGRFEYMIYQTLAGSWPLDLTTNDHPSIGEYKERIKNYFRKAISEAKEYDSWVVSEDHHGAYEEAFDDFIERLFEDRSFFNSMVDFQEKIAHIAAVQSLSQTVLKITSPGVPVIYQGTEMWDFSLVDPDNRRPVDFEIRTALLEEWKKQPPQISTLCNNWQNGAVKLFTLQKSLNERNANPGLYTDGIYTPLEEVKNCEPEKIVSFMRSKDNRDSITIVPRLAAEDLNRREPLNCSHAFNEEAALITPLPPGTELENIFTGEKVVVGEKGKIALKNIFSKFPVAQLVMPTHIRTSSFRRQAEGLII
jgi:(1->4)-alpha-D-glucan 1-alpha-D-glucosylmutase